MAAVTIVTDHNPLTKTITYTFSAKAQFQLIEAPNTEVPLASVTTAMFAFYKPALSGTYAAPAEANLYEDVTLESISGNAAGTILTATYTGEFEDSTAFNLYAIDYILETESDDSDSSANHIQAVFFSQIPCPVIDMVSFRTEYAQATTKALAVKNGGMYYIPTKQDEKCLIAFINTDSSNAETATIYRGDGNGAIRDISLSVAASETEYIVLESDYHKFTTKGHQFCGAYFWKTASADMKCLAIQLP